MNERERKFIRVQAQLDTKADSPGSVLIQFSVPNVIDKQGDITLPGAFESGKSVPIASYGHKWEELPVGRGTIIEEPGRTLLDGQFLLNTTHGRDTYETVKALGDLQEWSYGYFVEEASYGDVDGRSVRYLRKLNVFEVSPVLMGAGSDTRTLDLKGALAADPVAVLEAYTREAATLLREMKEGRMFSAANMDRMRSVLSAMQEAAATLEELVSSGTRSSDSSDDSGKGLSAFLDFQRVLTGLAGI